MDFIEVQETFTRHMRDPEQNPAPAGVEDRRMQIYRGLLYRNVEGFMANGFPVLRKITPDDRWHAMIRDYFRIHQARTPLFPRMPLEFLYYLEHERQDDREDFPFLLELAHYEWVEVELFFDHRRFTLDGIDTEGDLLQGIPILNKLVMPLVYRFPVHRISPDYLPVTAPQQPTYLIVYRDRNDAIGYYEMNPVAARLIDLLQQPSAQTGRELLQQIAAEMQHPDPDIVVQGGLELMQIMHSKDILPGIKQL